MERLQAIYDSEINVRLSWQWDGGVDWEIVQGFANDEAMASGTEDTVAEAVEAVSKAAARLYPDSAFAKSVREKASQLTTDFSTAARPLVRYLAENLPPYHKVVVTGTSAELLEGRETFVTDDCFRD